MYQEKIKNYKQSNKSEFDLGFNSERLAYIPENFSSYLDKSNLLLNLVHSLSLMKELMV